MPDPILTQAEENMAILVEGMTIADGYNYDWGTVNQPDLAKCTFPCAVIEMDPEETNLDEPTGVHAGAYLNEVAIKIRAVGKLDTEHTNPVFENNKTLNKALDDLKKVFGTNYSLNGTVDTIMYRRSLRITKQAGDIFIPSELESHWIVRYTQDRQNVTQPDP